MPWQKPTDLIISRSKRVRWWMRWDSTRRAFVLELGFPLGELGDDGVDGGGFALGQDDVVGLGVDGEAGVLLA